MARSIKLKVAGVALDDVLRSDAEAGKAIEERVHRTQLHRYRTGRGNPDIDTAVFLETVTGGRVRAVDWAVDASPGEPEPETKAAS